MRQRFPHLATGALMLGLAVAAPAAVRADSPVGRYTMQPVDGGILRLDTQTGAVSMCTRREGAELKCVPVQDDRGLQAEVDRLKTENQRLRDDVKRLEDMVGMNDRPAGAPPKGQPPAQSFKLPTEKEVDQALDYLDRMIRKFRDKLRDLEKDDRPSRPL